MALNSKLVVTGAYSRLSDECKGTDSSPKRNNCSRTER